MDIIALVKEAGGLSTVSLLLLALVGLYKQWWVPGWVFRAKADQALWWRSVAVAALKISEGILPKGNEGGD